VKPYVVTIIAVVLTAIIVGGAMYAILSPQIGTTRTTTITFTTTIPGPTITVTNTITTTILSTITSIVPSPSTTITPTAYTCPMPPEPSSPITLRFWKWQSLTVVDQKIQEVINLWNQMHPNVKIEFTVYGELSNLEFVYKVEQATQAGSGPDIIMLDEPYMAVLAYDGYLAEVPQYLQQIVNDLIVKPFDTVLYLWGPDMVQRMYALPGLRGASVKVLAVNDYMLQEIGLSKDWCPKDWNELLDVAKKLTKYDSSGNLVRSGLFVRVGGNVGGIFDKWAPLFIVAGGRLVWCENGTWKTDVDSDIGRKVMQLYMDVLYNYKIYNPGFPGDVTAFANEQVAMLLPREPTEIINAILAINPQRFKDPNTGVLTGFHFCPIPPPQAGMPSKTWLDMHLIAVNAKSPPEKQQWAFAFLCWTATDKDVKHRLYNSIGMWAPWKDIVNEPPFDQPIYQQMLEIVKTGTSRVVHPYIGTMMTEGGQILSQMYLKEISVDDGLKRLADKLLEIANEVPCR